MNDTDCCETSASIAMYGHPVLSREAETHAEFTCIVWHLSQRGHVNHEHNARKLALFLNRHIPPQTRAALARMITERSGA